LRVQSTKTFSNDHNEFVSLNEKANEKISAIADDHIRFEKEKAEQISRHEKEMKEIQKKFRDDLAVRSAVEYWANKQGGHRASAQKWLTASLILMAIGAGALVYIIYNVESPKEAVSAVSFAMRFTLLATLLVWPLRIFVRNYMSHVHLATDAAERAVIVQTYLALINDPDVKDSKELKEHVLPRALENIFRHAQSGFVKDDAMPAVSIIESLTKHGHPQ